MALNNLGLGFVITAKDVASPTFNRVTKSMRGLDHQAGKTVQSLAHGTAALGASMAVIRVGVLGLQGIGAVAKEAGEFELGMARVAAISNIAKDSTAGLMLEATALSAAMKTQFSPKEATEGLQQFAGAGFNAQQQADSLVPALRLAQAGMISVEDSARSMTSAIKVFGIETDQAGLVTDKLLKIANLTDLQAGDLSLALGTVGRGAGAAKQNLDEMLISMGLVKNTGVQASVAAQSVSSALLMLGKNAGKFEALGVKVTTADGKFRDFIDVVMDTDKALAGITNEAERTATATDLFGKFGLGSYQAISAQLTNGVQTATGEVLKGADAVQYLRAQLAGAEGTAAVFEEKILSTFEGQQALLKGIGQSLKVVLGQPFLDLMKPMFKLLLPLSERFVTMINALPPTFKKTLAGIALGVVGLTIALGGLLALATAFKFFGPLFAGSLGAMAPVLGVLAAIVVAGVAAFAMFKLFRHAADRDLGGIGKMFTALWAKIKLFARAIGQLFTQGFIDGDVLSGLLTDEMAGVRAFIGGIVRIVARLKAFFVGVGEGFMGVINRAKPIWTNFKIAVGEVVDVLAKMFGVVSKGNKGPIADFEAKGEAVGRMLGGIVTTIVDGFGIALRTLAGFIRGLMAAKEFMQPMIDLLAESFDGLVESVRALLIELGVLEEGGSKNSEVWGKLAEALGWVVSAGIAPVVAGLTAMLRVASVVFKGIGKLVQWVKKSWQEFNDEIDYLQKIEDRMIARLNKFAGSFKKIWQGIVDYVVGIFDDLKNALNNAIDFIAEVAQKIPARFRPEFLDEFIQTRTYGTGGGGSVVGSTVALAADARQNAVNNAGASANGLVGALTLQASKRSANRDAKAVDNERLTAALTSALGKLSKGDASAVVPTIKLIIDGKELAARTEAAKTRSSALAFEGG